jgi:hypothetical protein
MSEEGGPSIQSGDDIHATKGSAYSTHRKDLTWTEKEINNDDLEAEAQILRTRMRI